MKQSGYVKENEAGTHRLILGLRISALVETIAFLAMALLLDASLGAGDRFSDISPHPFWIILLLVTAYYGTNEGLVTAAVCSAAALVGNVPEQGFNEERTAWLLRVSANPVLWFMAALILGEIRSGYRRRYETLKGELESTRQQLTAITTAYEMLQEAKGTLEVRLAASTRTVQSVYQAFRTIEKPDTDAVLAAVPEMVRAIMEPKKCSVFLLKGSQLVATVSDGWYPGDEFQTQFKAYCPLFQMLVTHKQTLSVSDPAHESILAGEGILAGPLMHPETGEVFGMLKIEQIGFTGLNPSTLLNFQTVCRWIGMAYSRAQSAEGWKVQHSFDPMQQLLPGGTYDSQRASLSELAREACFDACAIYISFEPEPGSAVLDEGLVAQSVLQASGEIFPPNTPRFNFGTVGWTYAVLLPCSTPQMADDLAQRFSKYVSNIIAEKGCSVRARYLVEILHQSRSGGNMRSEAIGDAHQEA